MGSAGQMAVYTYTVESTLIEHAGCAWTGCVWTVVDTMHTDPTNHSAGQMVAVVHIDKNTTMRVREVLV